MDEVCARCVVIRVLISTAYPTPPKFCFPETWAHFHLGKMPTLCVGIMFFPVALVATPQPSFVLPVQT
eukprot:3565306-Alexandrium_andersonii.AAC.1